MIKTVINFFRGIEHSVESLTASLHSTVARLEYHSENQSTLVDAFHTEADSFRQKAYAAEAEAEKALNVAAKIKALLS